MDLSRVSESPILSCQSPLHLIKVYIIHDAALFVGYLWNILQTHIISNWVIMQ